MKRTFEKILKDYAIEHGLTQKDLCLLLDKSQPTISQYVNGKVEPTGIERAKILRILGEEEE